MKIFIASDSFKGSLTSKEVAESLKTGLLEKDSQLQVDYSEIADGGEGSLSAILSSRTDYEIQSLFVCDLLGHDHKAKYLLGEEEGKKTAIIESSDLLGLHLVDATSETVEQASSYGLGLALLELKKKGIEKVVVFLGGTGCSDGGIGLLQALGVDFLTEDKRYLDMRSNLLSHNIVDIQNLKKVLEDFSTLDIIIGTDVTNPYTGEEGAQKVFGKQKGATPQQIIDFDTQMIKLNELLKKQVNIDLNIYKGSGAAGGLGGILTLLGGDIHSGFDIISNFIGLSDKIADADLVITGEGSLDAQSANGKVPMKIATLAKKYAIPTLSISGRRDEYLGELEDTFLSSFSIQREVAPLELAISKEYSKSNLKILGKNIAGMLSLRK